MKARIVVLLTGVMVVVLTLLGAVALAQEVPPPYAGLENPFPWDDKAAQEAGKPIYERSCLACHGVTGAGIKESDFSTEDSAMHLEERPDLHFWILTEGNLSRGMPPYKSSLTDEQRWQTLNYIWSLGMAPAVPAPTPTPAQAPAVVAGKIEVIVPPKTRSGQELTFVASLQDNAGKPIGNVPVTFFIDVDFFTQALMEIGQAETDVKGIAQLKYTPRLAGPGEVVARYQSIEGRTEIELAESDTLFYQTETGLRSPPAGQDIFIGPEGAMELQGMGNAPLSALRLTGGIFSWLLLFAGVLALIWIAYFRVMYQVYRIPETGGVTADPSARRFPILVLVFIVVAGIIITLMVLTGPYSHFHLAP